jgi:hypothetical protein
MKEELVYPQWGKAINTAGGYYIPEEAGILPYDGLNVVFIKGSLMVAASCCSFTTLNYIQTRGFLLSKENYRNSAGETVSQIETMTGEKDRQAVRKLLEEKYPQSHIEIL